MVVEGCKEKTLMFDSVEELRQSIEKSRVALKSALGEKKPNKTGAQAWATHVECTIEQAFELLKLQGQYPELKDVFVELKALAQRADDDLFRYGTNMELPDYIN
jgi:hypothetical protein